MIEDQNKFPEFLKDKLGTFVNFTFASPHGTTNFVS